MFNLSSSELFFMMNILNNIKIYIIIVKIYFLK
jgi:hypothetical protein